MYEITKEQSEFLRRRVPKAYIVTCSQRKSGSKGNKKSGKTYYCPESKLYADILRQYEEQGGDTDE